MELVARYEAGERAADLAAEAGVTGPAVTGWARRLREEGALSLTGGGHEGPGSGAGGAALGAGGPEAPLRGARAGERDPGRHGRDTKDPGADPSALTAAERAALAESLRAEFGLPRVLAASRWPGAPTTTGDRAAAADPDAAPAPLVLEEFEAPAGYGYRRVHAALRARGAGLREAREARHARGGG